ncbi:hypothetical protein BON22_0842 [Cyberlindnera fabianii]|uniref:Uncharacterized protein n=1 Tax=Cyberlindnera fabianii TaxID=36022 RepID=A0A1V2LCP6_CYBFA|nr:hypothetical protein BON22_0842 [Cyberlindnera fabianii]
MPMETPQKKNEDPHTPQTQSVAAFPAPVVTPTTQITHNFSHGANPRRPSLLEARTACSSSSSLYELNVSASNLAGEPLNNVADGYHMSSSLVQTSSSDDDSETELDLDRIRTRRSNEIFKSDWTEFMGTQSPTFNPDPKQNGTRAREDYFAQLHHLESSTPIFKRLVSKNALKPQLKAFRRISSDLHHEKVPLQDEIYHEKLILQNLKDEESLLSSRNLSDALNNTDEEVSTISKFDIIKRANESWNRKKNTFLGRQSTVVTDSESNSDFGPTERNEEEQRRLVRKRSSFGSDSEQEFGMKHGKRRAVSTSPISTGFVRRGSIKLMSKASNELEKMSLKNE